MKMDKKAKVYLVFVEEEDDCQYWNQYESLEDAVSATEYKDEDGAVEVYEATPKLLGRFKAVPQKMKVKRVK